MPSRANTIGSPAEDAYRRGMPHQHLFISTSELPESASHDARRDSVSSQPQSLAMWLRAWRGAEASEGHVGCARPNGLAGNFACPTLRKAKQPRWDLDALVLALAATVSAIECAARTARGSPGGATVLYWS